MDFEWFAICESCWTSSVDNNFKLKWVRFTSLLSQLSIFCLFMQPLNHSPYCRFISHRCFICSTLKCNYVVWSYETIPIFIFFHANDKRVCRTLSKEKGCFWHKMKFLCLQSTVCRVCGAWQACQIKCETHVPFVKMVSWPMYTK